MLKFIKNLFKEKKAEIETVSLEELEKWFGNKTEEAADRLNSEINFITVRLDDEIKKTKDNLEILKSAALKNPKIPPRAIHMMEGNREAYIKKVALLIEKAGIKGKKPSELIQFCSFFNSFLDDFGKSTHRSYHVLQEFFANESSEIARNIKKIDTIVKELASRIKDSGTEKFDETKKEINSLKNKIIQKEEFAKDLGKLKKEKEGLIKDKEKTEKEIEEFKKSKEFEEFNILQNQFNNLLKEFKEHKYNLTHSFSAIEKALKKFARVAFEDERLIQNYMAAPVTSLLNDKELKIIEVLKKLEKNIIEDKIEIEEKKREKTLKEIQGMDRNFFINFLNEYNELNRRLDGIEDNIKKSGIKNREEKLNKQLVDAKAGIENAVNKIETLKKEIEKIDINKIKEDLQDKIINILKVDVVIK